jgi:hypothetical protein
MLPDAVMPFRQLVLSYGNVRKFIAGAMKRRNELTVPLS